MKPQQLLRRQRRAASLLWLLPQAAAAPRCPLLLAVHDLHQTQAAMLPRQQQAPLLVAAGLQAQQLLPLPLPCLLLAPQLVAERAPPPPATSPGAGC